VGAIVLVQGVASVHISEGSCYSSYREELYIPIFAAPITTTTTPFTTSTTHPLSQQVPNDIVAPVRHIRGVGYSAAALGHLDSLNIDKEGDVDHRQGFGVLWGRGGGVGVWEMFSVCIWTVGVCAVGEEGITTRRGEIIFKTPLMYSLAYITPSPNFIPWVKCLY